VLAENIMATAKPKNNVIFFIVVLFLIIFNYLAVKLAEFLNEKTYFNLVFLI